MAKSARDHVHDGLELLPDALIPFVEKRLDSSLTGHWQARVLEKVHGLRANRDGAVHWDQAALFTTLDLFWGEAFRAVLGRTERSFVNELVGVRNNFSHNGTFSYDDAERALDTMRRLVEAIGAGETAERLGRMRDTVLRTKYAELRRNEERRKTQRMEISVGNAGGMLPWREVVEPHSDVSAGAFEVAEFAADLSKVVTGDAPSEYTDPKEFFSRTYLTDGLGALLLGAARRLSGAGGDPVVELQTNFGGGKTHSMLALYHMASGGATGGAYAHDLPGLDQLLNENGLSVPAPVNRAVRVGSAHGPMDPPIDTPCGRKIRTIWGDLIWQLGGAEAFDRIAEADARGIAPGSDLLADLFRAHSPCLILIDEWVAYLRQIYRMMDLPCGSFDANLSFAQSLTEAVKAAPGALLVASLPASQIEAGGEGGQEALTRLKQTFSRVESSWLPASQEESYEIVRRRLFKQIPGDRWQHRDNTVKQFAKLYRDNPNDFPRGCADGDYRRKLEKAYPIHPELFDQLYVTWGAVEKFQRTRGVLRLMAQIIHELWRAQDPFATIMPGSVIVGSPRVWPELQKYLPENWPAIIAGDVDGNGATPFKIDGETENKRFPTQRVARTVFMATGPAAREENRGIDKKQVNLGAVQPGDIPAMFVSALERLANRAQFLHNDLGYYRYSMNPNLNRMADDRAEQVEKELVEIALNQRLKAYIGDKSKDRGHFNAVQAAPSSSEDVPDEAEGVRMVVLGFKYPHRKGPEDSEAMKAVKDILMHRGAAPRVNRNVLVFVAPDSPGMTDLESAVRLDLAWEGIVRDADRLDLRQSEVALAKSKLAEARNTTEGRLQEAWRWLIYPRQTSAQEEIRWVANKIIYVQNGLLAEASKRLVTDEALVTALGPERLDRDMKQNIWRDQDHIPMKDLWDYMSRYVYLPRLKGREVLTEAVRRAVSNMLPGPFAYAERWDEDESRYKGLYIEQAMAPPIAIDGESVIVRPEIAEAHRPPTPTPTPPDIGGGGESTGKGENGPGFDDDEELPPTEPPLPTRFIGTVTISPDRPMKQIGDIVEEIVAHLKDLPGAEITLQLEIDAEAPNGLDRAKARTLRENANTLGFTETEVK